MRTPRFTTGTGLLLLALLATVVSCEDPIIREEPVAVGAVEVKTPSYTLGDRESVQLTAVVKDTSGAVLEDYPVQWRSTDTTVATVSQTGLVRGRGRGLTWIIASAGGKQNGPSLQVYQANVLFIPDSLVFTDPTEFQRLFLRTYDADTPLSGQTAQFSVLDTTVVRVEGCGSACTGSSRGTTVTVYPRKPGATRIVGTWHGAADTASVRVLP